MIPDGGGSRRVEVGGGVGVAAPVKATKCSLNGCRQPAMQSAARMSTASKTFIEGRKLTEAG